MINIHSVSLVAIGLLLSGCGTINTVFRGDDVAGRNLKEWKTQCDSIPRVYSGFFYNLCVLNGPPIMGGKDSAAPAFVPLQIVDIIPSGILDTLVLPYTIYRQNTSANIDIPN